MSITFPPLRRDLEYIPVEHENQQFVLVRDQLELVGDGRALPLPLFHLCMLFDGKKSTDQIKEEFEEMADGQKVRAEELDALLQELDCSYLLESENFFRERDKIINNFTSQSVRHSSLAGRSYPDAPDECRAFLNDIMAVRPEVTPPAQPVRGVIAPHIDPGLGRTAYSSAYQMVRHAQPDRVIILGIGHSMLNNIYSLTTKEFQTPLGVANTDSEAVQALIQAGKTCVADTDFDHRSEHSIEFQVLFLQHVLEQKDFSIVPILCGSLPPTLPEYTRQAFQETTHDFTSTLQTLLNDPSQKTIILAGVDFSHIGPKFGHQYEAANLESHATTHDKALLAQLRENNPDGYWQESIDQQDKFNVCGFPAMATLLESLPNTSGTLLDYEIWHEEPTQSAVSFASMAFTATE